MITTNLQDCKCSLWSRAESCDNFSLSLAGISHRLKSLFTEKKNNETVLLQVSWMPRRCMGGHDWVAVNASLLSITFFFFEIWVAVLLPTGQSQGPYLHLRHSWLSRASPYNCYTNVNCTSQQKNVSTRETGQKKMRTANGGIPYAILSLLQSNSFLTS